MSSEIKELLDGKVDSIYPPQPFRNLIAQTQFGPSSETHEQFFSEMLAEIDALSTPYGFSNTLLEDADSNESYRMLPKELNNRLRNQAKRMGENVVFGTVLFGRMQGGSGADQAMGLFINTLPLHVDVSEAGVEESVRQTQINLAALLEHEHASLALAQRCSGIPAGTQIFSAILNCRHHSGHSSDVADIAGLKLLGGKVITNYPCAMSVDDFGTDL
ncbi:hypothetical protein BGZ80_008208, partial [Entomortierella chlamydospora]